MLYMFAYTIIINYFVSATTPYTTGKVMYGFSGPLVTYFILLLIGLLWIFVAIPWQHSDKVIYGFSGP